MATSQWLLARVAQGESDIYQTETSAEKQLALLGRASTERVRLERSFTSAMRELERLQQKRQACPRQPAQTAQTAQATPPPVHPPAGPQGPYPDYPMPEGTTDHPVLCAPAPTDSR